MSAFHDNMLLGASGAGGGYQIERSLRFNSADSAYLNRTPAGSGTGAGRTWTWSGWVKRSKSTPSDLQLILSAATSSVSSDRSGFGFFTYSGGGTGSDTFSVYHGAASATRVETTQVFRDYSSWYHIVVSVDTTQVTAGNRIRIYVNGAEVTQFASATYPAQNYQFGICQAVANNIGRDAGGAAYYFDGYLTECHLVDGQQLTPSSFGEINPVTGVWRPKKYTGTYGTNGFFLNFSDNSGTTSTTLGKDSSGNGNNWTPNNFSVTAGAGNDSMGDTPTYNCAILSNAYPLPWAENIGESGRLVYAGGYSGGYMATLSSAVDPTNDFYFELQAYTNGYFSYTGAGGCPCAVVFTDSDLPHQFPSAGSTWSFAGAHFVKQLPTLGFLWFSYYRGAGDSQAFYQNGYGTAPGTYLSPISGSCNNSGGYYGGSSNYLGLPLTGIYYKASNKTITLFGANEDGSGVQSAVYNISGWNTDFSKHWAIHGQTQYQSGFYGGGFVRFFTSPSEWRIATRPAEVDAPGAEQQRKPTIKKPSSYMDVVTDTGANILAAAQSKLANGADLIWIKDRANANNHQLIDTVRGGTLTLQSNTTAAESAYIAPSGSSVAWCWDRSATPGFDIVTYTGDGSNTRTINHGLGVTPAFFITKNRDGYNSSQGFADWSVYHQNLPGYNTTGSQALYLMSTINAGAAGGFYTRPTSTVFTPNQTGYDNVSTRTYVAYLWSEVAGFSKFGSYTGNGSTDGPFVYCGFRPRWVMVKGSSLDSHWYTFDAARNESNVTSSYLYPNLSHAEYAEPCLDFTSNGFKWRNYSAPFNAPGHTYIFAAFAESPFKYSLAR